MSDSLTYQHLWDACDRERAGAAAWGDLHARTGNAEIAARFARQARIFASLQQLVGRVADSPVLKQELAEIARRERLARAESHTDHEGTDDVTSVD